MNKSDLKEHIKQGNVKVLQDAIKNGELFKVKQKLEDEDGKSYTKYALLTKEEHDNYRELNIKSGVYDNIQLATKILLNSLYGALGTKYCRYNDFDNAKSVTLTGQSIIKGNGLYTDEYLTNDFFKEKSIVKKFPNIDHNYKFKRSPAVYTDTDSCFCKSLINSNLGEITIEDLYNKYENEVEVDLSNHGHEILNVKDTDLKVSTFDSNDNKVKMGKVDKIVRHKVTKSKWVLKSKCGKEVITTGDHSMMVIRDGELIEIKPSDINKKTDKLVVMNKKKK